MGEHCKYISLCKTGIKTKATKDPEKLVTTVTTYRMKGPDGLTILTSELTTVVSPVLSVTLRLRLNAAPDHHSSSGWPPS